MEVEEINKIGLIVEEWSKGMSIGGHKQGEVIDYIFTIMLQLDKDLKQIQEAIKQIPEDLKQIQEDVKELQKKLNQNSLLTSQVNPEERGNTQGINSYKQAFQPSKFQPPMMRQKK